MGIFKNQLGISLIEVTVAMGLTAAAGVAYMTHVQTVAKNEARQKVKNTLNQVEMEINDHFKHRDFCNQNVYHAFETIPIPPGTAAAPASVPKSSPTHLWVRKYGRDKDGIIKEDISTNIFTKGEFYDKLAGTIKVTDINYALNGIYVPNADNKSPYNRAGELTIDLTFQFCSTGGRVNACPPGIAKTEVHKIFKKQIAFKVDSSNLIEMKDFESFDAVTQKLQIYNLDLPGLEPKDKIPPATRKMQEPILACGDSQDAIIKESNDYTDKKICQAQAEALMAAGKPGGNKCGEEVIRRKIVYDISKSGTDYNFYFPTKETVLDSVDDSIRAQIVPGSMKVFIYGGGGGGVAASPPNCGLSGSPDNHAEINGISLAVEDMLGASCKLTSGAGGEGGKQVGGMYDLRRKGANGNPSVIICDPGPSGKRFAPLPKNPDNGVMTGDCDCSSNCNVNSSVQIDQEESLVAGERGRGGLGALAGADAGKGGDGVIRITWYEMYLVKSDSTSNDKQTLIVHSNGVCSSYQPNCLFNK